MNPPTTPMVLLTFSAGVVAATSYGCSLALAHLLTPGQFATYAAVSALITAAGVASTALIPLPLAAAVRGHGPGAPQRRDALTFALLAALVGGTASAVLVAGPAAALSDAPVVVAAVAAVIGLFALAPIWGLLQGESRYRRYAVLSVVEVVARVLATGASLALGAGAAGAVGAFAAGAGLVIVLGGAGLVRGASVRLADWRRVATQTWRWREVAGVVGVQAVLSLLSSLDAVVLAGSGYNSTAVAGYLVVATLVKAPLYLAVASATVAFPAARSRTVPADEVVSTTLRSFARLAVPVTAVVATVPAALVGWVLPPAYLPALELLAPLSVAAAAIATMTVLAMLLLALRERTALLCGLGPGAAMVATVVVVTAPWGPTVLAAGMAGAAFFAAVLMLVVTRLAARPAFARATPNPAGVLRAVVMVVVLRLLREWPAGWLVAIAVLGAALALGPLVSARARARADIGPGEGPHVLHLGFEDPQMPGAGGGSLRTAEINRRIAASGTRITVLTTRFPGARDRTEVVGAGSVRWVHIGPLPGRGRVSRWVGYLLAAPVHVRAVPADLIVEDFFAPISSMAVPWWTSRPTVGVVQWLNARDKAREYHLPLQLVERVAVRSHRRLIAVSGGVAQQLAALSPRAEIVIVGNGVDPVAREIVQRPRGADVVFVGRLEIAQKGLDLLLDAWACAVPYVPGDLVVAGVGDDEDTLRAQVAALGIEDRVRFVGWVAGRAKFTLVASARLAVVPSRFETFGIVAAEALAVGTPVVAYDIDCLREVVPDQFGVLVPLTGDRDRDVLALAETLVAAHADRDLQRRAAEYGPVHATGQDWDALAALQRMYYDSVLREGAGPGGARRGALPLRRALSVRASAEER